MRVEAVTGATVSLVPFTAAEVPLYWRWMQDPELLEMTETETGLSLEDVAEMQKNWDTDPDKFVFLIKAEGWEGEQGSVVGDVGLFYPDKDDLSCGECSLMLAEPSARRRGLAFAAAEMVMKYATTRWATTKFFAKLRDTNFPSAGLFRKLGFVETSRSEVFREITFEKTVVAETV